jgi:lysylphosphatidylglycerol synthetase-like protein (DUF2156 family)
MQKQSFAFERNGPRRLEIGWRAFWKDITVWLDGQVIGTFDGQKELKAGKEFPLPDGSKLHIQLVQKLTLIELRVLRDGQPLPGTGSDPAVRIKTAGFLLYFVAAVNLVLGAVGLFGVEFLQELGIGWVNLVYGLVFLVLAFFTMKRSLVAIILAVAIYALDGLAGFCITTLSGGLAVPSLLFHFFMLIGIIPGIGAIRDLKKQQQNP